MTEKTLEFREQKLNEIELLYKEYHNAKRDKDTLQDFLDNIDMNFVFENNLLIPDIKETIPELVDHHIYVDVKDAKAIGTIIHYRYTPAIDHAHDFAELIYVYSGKCKQTIDLTKISLKEGDICIIAPGVRHDLEVFDNSIIFKTLIRKSALDEISFNFLDDKNIISEYIHSIVHSYIGYDYMIFHTKDDIKIKDKFVSILEESINKDRFHHQMITNTMMLVFGILIRNYEDKAELPASKNKSDINRYKIMKIIQDNYKDITLDDIAEKLHYTREHTSRYIKQLTGKNLTDILKIIRLEKSKTLLLNTNMTVSNISENVGFNSFEYYIRAFKSHYGETPTQFRKYNN